jgi:hypothetical protein
MTPLFALLVAASTAADPLPAAQGPTTPAPVYTYTPPASDVPTDGSRPRLFSRLRRLFRRDSQPADQGPVTYPTTTAPTTNVWGSTAPPPAVTTTPTTTPALRPVPSAPPVQTAPAQKMPAGSPF